MFSFALMILQRMHLRQYLERRLAIPLSYEIGRVNGRKPVVTKISRLNKLRCGPTADEPNAS